MVALDLRSLIAKHNNPRRQALRAAAGLTLSRSYYDNGGIFDCFWLAY
jgi:hypothetical protein